MDGTLRHSLCSFSLSLHASTIFKSHTHTHVYHPTILDPLPYSCAIFSLFSTLSSFYSSLRSSAFLSSLILLFFRAFIALSSSMSLRICLGSGA
ncbi:hypothetical protein RJT34_03424 [Clitoria ternatea]|uniref:Uncharacterized protein n=1 Tax=Clitoria ternatea TaxID=43366 RepID=A0AAN9KM60_CLITE